MCNKSLASVPCDTHASCGISVRFQTLSHTQRQVAHALLTRPPLTLSPKGHRPFDLNVLCTPPAFILSQDQTLEIIVLKHPFGWFNLLPSLALSFFYFCLSSILICKNFPRSVSSFILCFVLLSCCSIFKDHFSSTRFARRPFYYTTFLRVCQDLF